MFSLLPAELQVTVLSYMDGGATIAEWVPGFETSEEMRAAAETAFGDWVAGQPLGSSFGEFHNWEAEVEFVKGHVDSKAYIGIASGANYMIVFVQHGVSVGVLLEDGAMRGWLTKESGRVPAWCGKEACTRQSLGFTPLQLRKAYVVVQTDVSANQGYRRAAVGQLNAENLEIVMDRVAELLWTKRRFSFHVGYLAAGLCHSSGGCLCGENGRVCDKCRWAEVSGGKRRRWVKRECHFILVERYEGPFPRPEVPWFTGVTEVMDVMRTTDVVSPWLAC
jgi:hypothetical protein